MDKFIHTPEGELKSVNPYKILGKKFRYQGHGAYTCTVTEASILKMEEDEQRPSHGEERVWLEFSEGRGVLYGYRNNFKEL